MSTVDFEQFAVPALHLPLGGRTYVVSPPSVEDAAKILALAVAAEVKLGIVTGEVPPEIQGILDTIGQDEHPALREAYGQMRLHEVPAATIDRAAMFAVFFWAKGRAYAEAIATLLFTDTGSEESEEVAATAPKG